ncbi:FAD/NAD(P)-binding domain-containing protein [Suillus decipiens]|nr:FAD/NAD(P)-binding domain-containing protein [Suillus decipiens]
MSLPGSTTVLIVGAGPAGLTAALSLSHHRYHDFVIVDAVVEGQTTSRALTIHCATVEALVGIDAADGLLSRAIKGKGVGVTSRSSQIFEAKFDPLKKHSAYPYALYIPLNFLGVHVHRPHKVVGMKQNEKDSRVTDVSFEDGQVIRAKYIIGADGARSIIRTIAGIGFADPEGHSLADNLTTQIVVADVTFEPEPVGPLTLEGHLNCVFSGNFFLFTPLGKRFNAELTREGKPTTKPIFPSDPSLNPIPVKIDQLRFRTHSAIAGRIFTRLGAAIFLVGDAAHIHSPFGGQGMNLAIRDAIFLSEAITKHIQMSAENPDVDDTILQEIADACHARAEEIIGFSKMLLNVSSLTYEPYAWWMPFSVASIRDLMSRILGRLDFVQSKAAWSLSGLGRR